MNTIKANTPETPLMPVGAVERPKGIRVRKPRQRSLLTFLLVAGPGLIVMAADNDAGAVPTCTQAGAQSGTHLLWLLVLNSLTLVTEFAGAVPANSR